MTPISPIAPRAMRDTFLESLYEQMVRDSDIFLVSADFGSPVLDKIRNERGNRFVNAGIAEQNLINVSAGLALEGFKVFAYAIAPFITMRCFEQIRVNLALLSQVRDMNVNLIGVGAGYSYVVSGPTHQCYEDLTLMRSMPNMRIFSPSDQVIAAMVPSICLESNGPKYIRLDAQVLPVLFDSEPPSLTYGYNHLRRGTDVALVATGYMVHTALRASDALKGAGISAGVIDLHDITNFDREAFSLTLSGYTALSTLEEGFVGRGGVDAMMLNYLNDTGSNLSFLNIGVEGSYRFEIGERQALHEQVGIGVEAVVKKIKVLLGST